MSRVADELGTGSSFGRARGISARRAAVAATTGVPTAGAPDSRLRTLPLEHLVPTRFNPRRNFGTDDDLREFGLKLKKKQLQPAVAVTRDAYLLLWPNEADAVGTARYVIANGERRYRGSQAADLPTLEVVVDDDIAKSRADFLDAVLSENNDRKNLDPIEQALGIKTMVEQLGGKSKVAEHYEKSGGWVTQQMYLLDLAPELQQLVSAGELPVRETRALVKLPPEQQVPAWEARQAQREEEKAQPRPRRAQQASTPPTVERSSEPAEHAETFTAVKKVSSETSQPADDPGPKPTSFTAVKNDADPERADPGPEVPEMRTSEEDTAPPEPEGSSSQAAETGEREDHQQPKRLPYDDGLFLGHHLAIKVERDPYFLMLRVLLEKAREKDPQELAAVLKEAGAEAV